MNVLLISQCGKRALTETRRILDQFAERRGERTWQTPITQAGLDTLRRLLRKSARKNTAVACHWIRGHDHSELLWIVGNARRFNAEGSVPTNTTGNDVLRGGDENDWHTAELIRLLAKLSALLHDLGKASVAFQERLAGKRHERNLYRHEWVSLRMFLAFVDADDDDAWLARMADAEHRRLAEWTAKERYLRDGVDADISRYPFRDLTARAPLAAAIAWLIVTHHRLPVVPRNKDDGSQDRLGKRVGRFEQAWLDTPLAEVTHAWNEIDAQATPSDAAPYWNLAPGEFPAMSKDWRKQTARVAKTLLALQARTAQDPLDNPFVMHLSRLCLMLADHHYSSLGVDANCHPAAERARFVRKNQIIHANTTHDRAGKTLLNQSLLEHLLGVGHNASLVAHALPDFARHLPRLANHRGLRRRSADKRFAWQDKAFDAAVGLRENARDHGTFIVNMASTGCGKTLANVRMLYALSDPQLGMRVSYALGLRTLTQQTGHAYEHDLHLKRDELAVLVGGSANRALFDYYEQQAEAGGSASRQSLLEEDSHVLYEGNTTGHPLLKRALADPKIAKLLCAPMLVCTVDHLAPATEALRAGRQIAPMLRLMSSDLVLDELDDYDLDDLPALTRLMHWAGMLGTRVVLSSATLPPALVEGMFLAYRAGRGHYHRNRGNHDINRPPPVEIPCLWADEFGVHTATCADEPTFTAAHAGFASRRADKLQTATPLRHVELLPLRPGSKNRDAIRATFAQQLRDTSLTLHQAHAHTDPVSGKRVSFGLVRMANIEPIIAIARRLHELGAPDGMRIHLCVYHARFPLAQRSAIEHMLDTTFNRRTEAAVLQQSQVRHALDGHDEPDQLFVVLASPVCEVGRDWDADWAIAEPSSMRSLIQLAGRVQRHRQRPPDEPNIYLFDTNLKALEQHDPTRAAFTHPGYENKQFVLERHRLGRLLAEDEYRHINARPRILSRTETELKPRHSWVDLEQARIRAGLLPAATLRWLERDQAAPAWQCPQAALTGVLPQQQPFREDTLRTTTLVWLPDEDEQWQPHRVEKNPAQRNQQLYLPLETNRLVKMKLAQGPRITAWGDFKLQELLLEHAEAQNLPLDLAGKKFSTVEVPQSNQGWDWHPWLGFIKH